MVMMMMSMSVCKWSFMLFGLFGNEMLCAMTQSVCELSFLSLSFLIQNIIMPHKLNLSHLLSLYVPTYLLLAWTDCRMAF